MQKKIVVKILCRRIQPTMDALSASEPTPRQLACRRCLLWFCKAKIITVEPVLFLYVFASYLYLIIFELYTFNWYGRHELEKVQPGRGYYNFCLSTAYLDDHGSNGTNNRSTGDIVEGITALTNLIVGISGQLPSVFAALIIGPLSDRLGRKPAMIFVLTGACLQSVVAVVIINFGFNLYYFVLGSGLKSITGGMAGLLTLTYSYIADISPRKHLTIRLGVLEAMTFLAGMVSFGVGAAWIQLSGCNFKPVTWLQLASIATLFPFLVLFVPESTNKRERERRVSSSRINIGPKSLLRGVYIFIGRRYSRWKLWLALLTMTIVIINSAGASVIMALFLLHEPLEWEPYLIGLYFSATELVHGMALLILLPIMVALVKMPDVVIALIGVSLGCVMSVCMGFVVETWQMFAVGAVQGVGTSVVIPALKAIMSKLVAPEDQGALFSFITATQVVATVVSMVIYGVSYHTTLIVRWQAGTSFFLMAIIYVISIFFVIVLLISIFRAARRRSSVLSGPSFTVSVRTDTSINYSPDNILHDSEETGDEAYERKSLLSSMASQRSYDSIMTFSGMT